MGLLSPKLSILLFALLTCLLTACGGGGSNNNDKTQFNPTLLFTNNYTAIEGERIIIEFHLDKTSSHDVSKYRYIRLVRQINN